MRGIVLLASVLLSSAPIFADTAQARLKEATDVFTEIMATPDNGIPQDLMEKAECIGIVPGMKKAAFVVGGEYGRGFVMCRKGAGWTAPAAIRMEGGSVGFQIGASSTDLVLLVMNQHGMNKLMEDKFTLGADASVAAGPVGRAARASTDAQMSAEILAWSRSKGLFAGIALNGATLRPDKDENSELYGQKMGTKEVLTGSVAIPASAHPLVALLNRYPHESSSSADRVKK
jgi:lipid-binding SYLF domain-containing protein